MKKEENIKLEEAARIATEEAKFKKMKGSINKLYGDDRTIQSATGGRKPYYDVEKVKTREQLLLLVKENLSTPYRAGEASEVLVATNGIYAQIIEYYTNIPLFRYTVIPQKIKNDRTGQDSMVKYEEVYQRMIAVVDGISLEVTLPKILQTGLIYGIIYLYSDKDKSSETIETFMLPNVYCKKGFATNFGTDTVIFDFKFFDDFKMKLTSGSSGMKITEDDLYELFPVALIKQYEEYKKKPAEFRYQSLDPKLSCAISFSHNSMPPKLYASFGIIDYDITKANEIQRSQNELEKILVHQIPHTGDGELMFDLDEAVELHSSMAKALNGVKGLKLLTTFGATELLELQPEKTKENKTLQQAYDNIFNSAGMNPALFNADSKESLAASLQRDQSYIFKQLDLIINFYNLAINNLYNFNPYQASINLLHISNYDEIVKIPLYMSNANFGIGKLEAIVATGIKQRDITDKYELEKFLELDKILVPLQSAYTSTPSDVVSSDKTVDAAPAEEKVKTKKDTVKGT